MAQTLPDWFILIEHLVTRGGTGYTLPFLAGARAQHLNKTAITLEEVHTLLEEIFHQPVKNEVAELTWCANFDAPVFGLSRIQIPGKVFKSEKTNTDAVVVRQDIIDKWGNSSEDIIKELIRCSEEPIVTGNFSRTSEGTWESFTEDERFRINNLLNV
ncbi:MAG: hypothetical protein GFH27_549349n72 [Chloroflexi bacterium AL-W]|nr:hypothetical protein [Chloroflexi bacterium AL-N1]NOK69970.1 hypothetical protein [Chloroflexi bacterium AL-N10]NOK73732.1 hypothetical protein [Chloroflexi bacterium AL-N5]NOK85502.1 hypothetical protein [Chloroflexi bacterium AL-W]NOK91703.1 hypothetical protein [Chloroflexi bacterium AL-N15]